MCEKKINVPALFGEMVFGEQQMQQRLPADVYRAWQQSLAQGTALDRSVAGEIAGAMKDWAIEKGATHYTHWFQPMTGFTAEKHDSFITRDGKDGVRMELSAKELNKGEADASSFPSGGLRATFEARGYTAWDPTSYAFVKDDTLYIPTIFCSYSGQTLDKKTPLLRSMRELDRACVRILRLFGNTEVQHVTAQVGPEQEYFLIDKSAYERGPEAVRSDAVRRQTSQGSGAGRPLLRRHQAPRGRIHAGAGSGAVEAGCTGQDGAQRGGSSPA